MTLRKARDLMVLLDEYPIVDSSATILDAVTRLEESRRNTVEGKQPFQAVLVADEKGDIVGKVGQFALLKALEPKSRVSGDQDALARAGVSDAIMETALDHYRSFQSELADMCTGAAGMPVSSIMTPFGEHIDIDTAICEVVHRMLEWQTMSVLVTKNDHPVGLVRLADLCDEVMRQMRHTTDKSIGED